MRRVVHCLPPRRLDAAYSVLPVALVIGLSGVLCSGFALGAEDPQSAKKAPIAAPKPLRPEVFKVEEILKKGLDQRAGGFKFSVIAEARTGSVELFQIEDVKPHYHPRETHFLYILKGRAKGQIGRVAAEVGPGDLVVIPAGKAHRHSFKKVGDEPVVFLLFSTPPFRSHDIVWTEP